MKEYGFENSSAASGLLDHLTGLPAMTLFLDLADKGCRKIVQDGEQAAILFFDICGMKNYNHKYGFAEGDSILKAFAAILERLFYKDHCSRFIQDHFVVFCSEKESGEKIQALFDEWQESDLKQTLPIRVGVYVIDSERFDLITACDNAKAASDVIRNTFISRVNYYDKALQTDLEKRDHIVSNFDRALSEQWIQVYYQPIVRTVNGRVCDEEALSRWVDPERGMLAPDEFIGILEDAHLIYKLDLYVVEQIIRKIGTMKKEGLHIVPQSVNLSRIDFEECDIVEEICKRMDEAGLEHSLLNIEITESIVASDFDYMKTQIERFRNLGFQVWMDDFGSGYSSLDVLQDLTFDLIKFDMRFVKRLDDSMNSRIILTELMRMATALGLETVCEGIESKEHVEFLGDIGCCKLQGYYYAKPMPLNDILDRYRNGEQIGFENPEESGYFDTLGRINLYDLDWIMADNMLNTERVYESVPMVIMELNDEAVRIVRSNASYRDFSERTFERNIGKEFERFETIPEHHQQYFLAPMLQCAKSGTRMLVDEQFANNTTVHTFMRRVACNPISGTKSVAVAILSVTDDAPGASYLKNTEEP
ncbi:MAG: EAL domain-containing protein [Lachnospiraceae bacterium]|nr:EAL domain-containing protein [Lachnospiraceae bacterium]